MQVPFVDQAKLFQSTRLMRGATHSAGQFRPDGRISIHAPHARRDLELVTRQVELLFQSTRLMRGATWTMSVWIIANGFQSTRLMRGATEAEATAQILADISIHAPHARRDRIQTAMGL